jgi:predicted nucleotidyltransferase
MLRLTKKKAQYALNQLKEKLRARFADKVQLYVFGSVARGDFGLESDIDVLVVIDGPVNTRLEEEILDMIFEIELDCDVVFGVIIYSKAEWDSPLIQTTPLHKNIDREGALF